MNYNEELLKNLLKSKVLEKKPEARFMLSSFHSPKQYTRNFKVGWVDHKNRTWKQSFDFLLCFNADVKASFDFFTDISNTEKTELYDSVFMDNFVMENHEKMFDFFCYVFDRLIAITDSDAIEQGEEERLLEELKKEVRREFRKKKSRR